MGVNLDAPDIGRLVALLALGWSRRSAAGAAGIAVADLRQWLDDGHAGIDKASVDFVEQVEEAERACCARLERMWDARYP